ncbi:CLUMA_CG004162, isoform A [Clunio marinus]|uniref:CLUMA_CG004162, isoform A n=1 Tax=Clunio marinus TaxID=568069 RepID=A0A1J1HR28_9DIPT|nr:CLUMA_CG004162, isoform A [Clunio marinus]
MKIFLLSAICVILVAASPSNRNLPQFDDKVELQDQNNVNDEQEISPMFNAATDTRFLLFTRFNPTIGQVVSAFDMSTIQESNYSPARPTRVLIHGWQSNADSNVNVLTTAGYLRNYDVNVIVVDWSIGANNINYIASRNQVNNVGAVIAVLLDNLQSNGLMADFSRLSLIGHSLGAHIAGAAGKRVLNGRINTIIGLDPAGPLFSVGDVANRLDGSDAAYVEAIHTDIVQLGIGDPIADTDFYPNGGTGMPGCLTAICDHDMAIHYFVESLNSDRLWGRRCANLNEMTSDRCSGFGASMGGNYFSSATTMRLNVNIIPTQGNSNQITSIDFESLEIEGKLFRPLFNPTVDVKFLLFTRRNPFVGQRIILGDIRSLFESNFNISNPTRFLIHGWGSDLNSFFNIEGTEAYLRNNDFNVIVVDWSRGAQTINYVQARNRVGPVGRILANFIDFLHDNEALNFEELTVVGFSLGAHVAGFAGKNVNRGRINTIIGLDPAGPLFPIRNPSERLNATDAEYVEIIHTNSRMTGIGFPIGDADFYPNGGMTQPGCVRHFCHHDRAPLFFIESINSNNFFARACLSFSNIGRDCIGEEVTMGGEPSNSKNSVRGIFYLTTNRRPPFAQGPRGRQSTSNLP